MSTSQALKNTLALAFAGQLIVVILGLTMLASTCQRSTTGKLCLHPPRVIGLSHTANFRYEHTVYRRTPRVVPHPHETKRVGGSKGRRSSPPQQGKGPNRIWAGGNRVTKVQKLVVSHR